MIIDYLSGKGDILFQRAYADWSVSNTKSWKDQLNKTPITAIQQFHHNEKQAVDKLIMMDAIEITIKHEDINLFAIIASDNGYHSLALRLRELGKRVVGIGEKEKCNSIWIKSCNEFSYLEDLDEKDEDILLNEKNENDEDINLKDYGVKSPRELILKLNSKFKLTDDGKPQRTFFVEKTDFKENEARKTGVIKRRIKNFRIISADDESGDYFFYMGEINPQFKGNKLEKGTKVDFKIVDIPKNNDSETKNGRATDVKVIG